MPTSSSKELDVGTFLYNRDAHWKCPLPGPGDSKGRRRDLGVSEGRNAKSLLWSGESRC